MNKEFTGDLVVIVGPTAVGKTALSIGLAQNLNGEIISGDSMQVYRGMDIGTAKASPKEREMVPHHLLDIKDPHQSFSVAEFQSLALEAIGEISQRGRLPILVGGTGLYIKSVLYYPHYPFGEETPETEIRTRWQEFVNRMGSQALWEEAHKVDPVSAARLHPNDTRRLIRVLEVYETTGIPLSSLQPQADEAELTSPFRFVMIGLTMPREMLYQRINQRVEQMIRDGLIDEVRSLLQNGVPETATSMQSLGYKEVIPYLKGGATLEETIELIQRRTRQFAKRQLTWFRNMKEIHWFDVSNDGYEKILSQITHFVEGKLKRLENN
jgi:tRNA dimethylallyltransferase